jgi:ribosomal protein S18 acetylase RimI-like enzyme
MIFEKLDKKYIEDAAKLSMWQYNDELSHVEALYEKDYTFVIIDFLSDIFKGNNGVVAIERGKLVGYLSFWGGINNLFGNVKGAFSPMFSNAYGGDNRGNLASLLFQYASEEMVKKEILSYSICSYSHDYEVMRSLNLNGFGIRCSDGIRNIDKALDVQINSKYSYEELHYSQAYCLLTLHNYIARHLRNSPTYFPVKEASEEEFIAKCSSRQSRFFVARDKSEIIGYYEITGDGETLITEEPDYLHICGAYLKEDYRGKNILQSLLAFVLERLKEEGVKRLGVDYETINPNALGFWTKYFDTYTYSFVRRIDERILDRRNSY